MQYLSSETKRNLGVQVLTNAIWHLRNDSPVLHKDIIDWASNIDARIVIVNILREEFNVEAL